MKREKGWNDDELERKVDEKLDPILKQLNDACAELGIFATFVGQVGNMHFKEGKDGEQVGGYRMMARPVNMQPVEDAMKRVVEQKIEVPDSEEGIKELLGKNNLPGPMMMVQILLQSGKINTEKLLIESMFRTAMARAIEHDDFGSFESFMQKMQQEGIVIPGQERKRKREAGWVAKEDAEGNFIGFVNPETGEEDLLN